jgi:hypothetical protein
MMDNFPLPPELEQLERQLAVRERPQPLSQAKQRLLCSVRAESRRSRARSRRAFAVAMAATVLVWLNLSLCATQATDFGLELDGRQPPLENDAAQIQQLLPDLAPSEAMRQAVLLRAGARVVPCPKLPASYVAILENDSWRELID